MNIAIIGGGFTGLAAAYRLSQYGHKVTVFEKEPHLGGLAYGFREPTWKWHIEAAYHHLFTNDRHILSLIKELGIADRLIVKRPVTSTLWNGTMYQLDSPFNLFAFPGLSLADKLRTAILLSFFKLFPFWRVLETVTAEQVLKSVGGGNAWKILWEPLLYGKFGTYAPNIAASWFWARIVKRTPSLCYIDGGFHTLVQAIEQKIMKCSGTICTNTAIESVHKLPSGNHEIIWGKKKKQIFDRILVTIPTPLAKKILPAIPTSYISPLMRIPHLFAQTLIIETDKAILNRVYWLNVTDRSFPFLAAVAHTNFMDAAHYGNKHLTYFGNYLPQDHPYLSMTKEQLLKTFMPHIKRLLASPHDHMRVTNSFMFVGPFAQPVHERNYSSKIPPVQTPIPGVYMANMDFVVPWDRGTNYAVELGMKAAQIIMSVRT